MVSKKPVTPFFSIITCTRNSSSFISKCLSSVKQQTFRDFEHIIIDGNSKDSTRSILQEYGVAYHAHAPRGIANAMNSGLGYAKGEYIYFLNSDDSFYDNHVLQKVHDYLVDHPKLDWVFGNIHETDGEHTIGYPPKRKIFQGKHPNLLKFYNYIPHQATFISKSIFKKYGLFDESLRSMMDPEYWLRIAQHTNWGYMPIVVANYLIRPDSQSENLANAKSNTREYELVQSKYLSTIELFLAKLINTVVR